MKSIINKIKKLSFGEKIELLIEIINLIKKERENKKISYMKILKYKGLLKTNKIEPLEYQRKRRDEWRESLSS